MTDKPDEAYVGVVFLTASAKAGSKLITIISKFIERAQGLEIRKQWEDLDGQELVFQLSRYTHLIMVFDETIMGSHWLRYITGFVVGSHIPLYFVYPEADDLPGYLKPVKIFKDMDSLVSSLQHDLQEYSMYRRVEDAREELIGRGYGLTENMMALSCQDGKINIVELYLTLGFSPDSVDDDNVALLNHAVRQDHEDILALLLEHGANPNIVSGDRGNTPLMDAASLGLAEYVRPLLAADANPDYQSKNGQTALMMAVGENNENAVQLLVKYGADLAITDELGMTAEKYARLFQNEAIVKLVSKSSA